MNDLINIDALSDALSRKIFESCNVGGPRLLNLDQAAVYLGMTTDAGKSEALMGQMRAVRVEEKR